MDGTVIIADDDKNLRAVLTQSLTRAGAKVRATATLSTLWRWLEEGEGDVVLCDVNLADGDAIDLLPKMRALRPDIQFVLMSAQNTIITALRASDAGAFEYLAKPFDLREMIETIMRAKRQSGSTSKQIAVEDDLALPLIGRSEAMQEVYRKLAKVIPSDLPLLISGESGTGKSLTSQVIHNHGPRSSKNLQIYDGSGIQENGIIEAFTLAGDGTLIFDKIDEFLPSEQLEIVRAIEKGCFPARLISTSGMQLIDAVNEGRVRADLYHHLNVLNLEMPNLQDRSEDIKELVEFFSSPQAGVSKTFTKDAITVLERRPWRGNVKELKSAVSRLIVMGSGDQISASDVDLVLSAEKSLDHSQSKIEQNFSEFVEGYVRRFIKIHGQQLPPNGFYTELIDQVDRPAIEAVLELTGGNQIRTAQILGINRNTLRKKIQNLDISVTKGKKLM